MERKTKIKLLRVFAFIVALVGVMEAFFMFIASTSLSMMFLFTILGIGFFTLMRILVSAKWRTDDGKEESTIR